MDVNQHDGGRPLRCWLSHSGVPRTGSPDHPRHSRDGRQRHREDELDADQDLSAGVVQLRKADRREQDLRDDDGHDSEGGECGAVHQLAPRGRWPSPFAQAVRRYFCFSRPLTHASKGHYGTTRNHPAHRGRVVGAVGRNHGTTGNRRSSVPALRAHHRDRGLNAGRLRRP